MEILSLSVWILFSGKINEYELSWIAMTCLTVHLSIVLMVKLLLFIVGVIWAKNCGSGLLSYQSSSKAFRLPILYSMTACTSQLGLDSITMCT